MSKNIGKLFSPTLFTIILLDDAAPLQMVERNNYNNDKFVNEFGLRVKTELTSIDARVLPAPMVVFYLLISVMNKYFTFIFFIYLFYFIYFNQFFNCCSLSTRVHKRSHEWGVGT